MLKLIVLNIILLLSSTLATSANDGTFTLASKNITIQLNKQGVITGITFNKSNTHKALNAYTEIQSFVSKKDIAIPSSNKQSYRFEHELYSDSLKQSCKLVETFIATNNSIRWEIEIAGNSSSWASVIRTVIKYPASNDTRFWTTWGQPQFDSASSDPKLVASLSPYKNSTAKSWLDPLVPMSFTQRTLYYGAPPFAYDDVKQGFAPFQGNIFAIPFASVFEKNPAVGLSVFLSPENDIINLLMKTSGNGTIQFERLFNRVSKQRKLKFSLDLVVHEDDWRSALQWFALRYPEFINPKNATVGALGGTAAYSNFFDGFDADKMKKMAFTVNWQASFDFPYMGMFLPPLPKDVQWTRLGGDLVSIRQMDEYAKRMKQRGFYVLNYFNVTEFGTDFKYPPPPTITDSKNLWKDGSNYLYKNFPGALLKVADQVKITKSMGAQTIHGGPYYSWKYAVAVDCGDSAYQKFLLNQAKRHTLEIPNSFGICIDRLDWLRFINENADDKITWFNNKPARSLVSSWKDLMEKLGPLMHHAGKYIFVNNHYKRIDLLKHADGILDEFTNATTPLNTTAFLTINKPALGWTPSKEVIEGDGGDNFFQKYLYLGVFPMCPFPGNDHALQPDSMVDKLYLDYGPLMIQMKEKQWVLKPGVVHVKDDKARVNLFKTKNGYSIPVVYGDGENVTVVLNDKIFNDPALNYQAYFPGRPAPFKLQVKHVDGAVEIDVPLVRGAAMVTVSK